MASLFSTTIRRLGLLPWVRIRAGTFQVVYPEWLYDLFVFVFFPFNWFISFLAGRVMLPYNRPDWPLDPELAPGKLPAPQRSVEEMAEIIRRRDNTRIPDRDVWELFDSLPAPSAEGMIGNWRGKVLFTGGWLSPAGYLLEIPLRLIGVEWGKRYFTTYRGDPLIFILWKRLVIPVPMWGSVSLPEIKFRGKTGATMVYDHQPWKDHFRVLDDGRGSGRRMFLGNWMSREKMGGWFTLEELPELDAAMTDVMVKR
jgi:hypothetical protein